MVRTERDIHEPADQAAGDSADEEPRGLRMPLPGLVGAGIVFLAAVVCGGMVWAAQRSDYLENLPFEVLLIVWPVPAAIGVLCSRQGAEDTDSPFVRGTSALAALGGLVWALLADLWLAAAMQ